MKEKKIMLPSVEEAKHFVAEATKCGTKQQITETRAL